MIWKKMDGFPSGKMDRILNLTRKLCGFESHTCLRQGQGIDDRRPDSVLLSDCALL